MAWLYLIIRCPKATSDVLVIKHLHLEAEVLLEVLDDHDQEGQLDAQRLLRVCWASDEGCADIGGHDLQDGRLYVLVCDALDVPIAHCIQGHRTVMIWVVYAGPVPTADRKQQSLHCSRCVR